MSDEFEEKQTVAEDDHSAEANEPISSTSDLEQEKKRAAYEFYAQGNTATTQIFIGHLGSMDLDSWQKNGTPPTPSASQAYSLHTRQGCREFVERYKNSEYLAVAIVLSVFELVYLGDLHELEELLLEELPDSAPVKEDTPLTRDPYISVDTYLSTIGGERFTSQEGKQYVGLGESAQKALQNIWEQFFGLRDPICRWLVMLCRSYKTRVAFDAYQIVCAFARVTCLDFEDARKRIFSRLYSSPENVGLLGNLVCKLYEETSLRGKLEDLLLSWLGGKGSWLWRPACLACSFLMPGLDERQLGPALERAVGCRLYSLTKSNSTFLAILMLQSKYFRDLLAQLLSRMARKAGSREERLATAQTYLYLLRSCYYLVDDQRPELPLAACDAKEQQEALTPVLAEVMGHIDLRKQLYAILRVYLKELDRYQYSNGLFNHLCAYFYNLTRSAPAYWPDIMEFLSGVQGESGKRLHAYMLSDYCGSRQLPSLS